jgi:hypothetical protein
MATPTSPNDLTRQQLDELDTLLQRMLALPIHANDPAPAPVAQLPEMAVPKPVSNWRADAPMPVSRPNLTTAPVPEMAMAFAEPKPTPALPYEPAAQVSTGTLRGVDAPAMPYGYQAPEPEPLPDYEPITTNFDVNPFASSTVVSPVEEKPVRIGVPLLLWPMFGVNAVLEWLLGWFGPIGHLLTRPMTKTLLGWCGVLLMLAAGYWCARGLGYVTWPVLPAGL